MERDHRQTIDEVVNDIDDLKTAVEELEDERSSPTNVQRSSV